MEKMPVLFIGHGSPMNAIEINRFSNKWIELGNALLKPKAILMISAHWYTRGQYIRTHEKNKQIYDMYGFPRELYELIYEPKNDSLTAKKIVSNYSNVIKEDNSWGIDHGAWEVLTRMYPKADIPVIMLSVNANAPAEEMFKIGNKLKYLRNEGILIIGSGNIVHNLSLLDFSMNEFGYKESIAFDQSVKKYILEKDFAKVLNYESIPGKKIAFSTNDHFSPLSYVLGFVEDDDEVEIFNEGYIGGSLSMTSYIFK